MRKVKKSKRNTKMVENDKIKETIAIGYFFFPGYHVVLHNTAFENHISLSICLAIYQTIYTHTTDNKSNTNCVDFSHLESVIFSEKSKIRKECHRLASISKDIISHLAYPCAHTVNKAHDAVS